MFCFPMASFSLHFQEMQKKVRDLPTAMQTVGGQAKTLYHNGAKSSWLEPGV